HECSVSIPAYEHQTTGAILTYEKRLQVNARRRADYQKKIEGIVKLQDENHHSLMMSGPNSSNFVAQRHNKIKVMRWRKKM
uniref:Uncharacterized protein n=1 Tax=Triticum urartu TaxID=4572 RepID=A0A8R7Q0J0_TRIUA